MDKTQLFKVPPKYGLAGGVLCIVLFITIYKSDKYPLEMSSYFMSGAIIMLMLYFSTRELRDYKYGGKLEYWQGMTAGMVCVLIISTLSGFFIYIYASQIDSKILTDHALEVSKTLSENPEGWIERHGEEGYQKLLEENKKLISPFKLGLDDFFKKFMIGFFITTIIALLFKRK